MYSLPPPYEKFLRSAARARAEQEGFGVVHQSMVCDESLRLYARGAKPADAIETALKAIRKIRKTQLRNENHEKKKKRGRKHVESAPQLGTASGVTQ